MKDVCMDFFYIFVKSIKKNSSSIVFNKLLRETLRSNFKNSPKMELKFFKAEIWYASL